MKRKETITKMVDIQRQHDLGAVFYVYRDGQVFSDRETHSPNVYDEWIEDSSWEFLNGASGQCGYKGPVMHPSENFGPCIADTLLRLYEGEPFLFSTVEVYPEINEIFEGEEFDAIGWAIVHKAP